MKLICQYFPAKFIQLKKVSHDKNYLHYWNTLASILKYFNSTPVIVQDQRLPEPTSSLSNFVPPKAIELANTEVEKVKNKGPQGTRSAPYLILTPTVPLLRGFRWVKSCRAWHHSMAYFLIFCYYSFTSTCCVSRDNVCSSLITNNG